MPAVLSIAYIDRLPSELLSCILRIVESENSRREGATSRMKFVLAKVCRRWRSVAHGTAQLWADLPVTLNTLPAYVVFIFSLTQHAPLALTIDLARQLPHPPGTTGVLESAALEDFLRSVAPILAKRAMQVQRLHIVAFFERELRQALIALGPLSDTVLKDLHLEVICPRPLDEELDGAPEPLPLWHFNSCVQTLSLINVPLLRANIMFGNVASLTLDRFAGLTWSDLSSGLRGMPVLETLALWGPVCGDYNTDDVVCLPTVTMFEVKIMGSSDMTKAITLLRMPALTWLRISRTNGAVKPVLDALGNALSGVTRLDLYSKPMERGSRHEDEISTVWERTPNLTIVNFGKTVYTDMKKFTSTLKENPGKLPGLKSIRTEYGFPSASITGLLQSTGATVITPSSETGFTEERWDLEGGVARRTRFTVWAV
ncbi:hypothetical protein C8F04DRAFT_1260857 [Mycena alexandri]|uniref:F-box domain-containing protein n=1 Tax=Mycena alexandri TaxID=1745969 RepID=A0AAD6X2U1_9AGAR|nr:hypothetical protein C8F04DRAFT_1260857 [Mycena alexandri]